MLNGNWALSAMEFSFDHVLIDKREKKKRERKKICKFIFVVFATFFGRYQLYS